jgi:hypothetical protein
LSGEILNKLTGDQRAYIRRFALCRASVGHDRHGIGYGSDLQRDLEAHMIANIEDEVVELSRGEALTLCSQDVASRRDEWK